MRILTLTLICLIPLGAAASNTPANKIHADVQSALTYQIPLNSCKVPRLKMTSVEDTRISRYEKSYRSWVRCAKKYQNNLIDDFDRIKAVAKHGLTTEQADILMGHLKNISATKKSMKDENIRLYEPLLGLTEEQKNELGLN